MIIIRLLRMHRLKKNDPFLSKNNIAEIMMPLLGYRCEVAGGMLVGAIIGGLKQLGWGTVLGAFESVIIISLTRPCYPI